MRKKLILFTTIIAALVVSLSITKVHAAESIQSHFVGNSINVAKAKTRGNFVKDNNVLSSYYTTNVLTPRTTTAGNYTKTDVYTGESKREIFEAISADYQVQLNLKTPVKIFTVGASEKLKFSYNDSTTNYSYNFFADYTTTRVSKTEWIDKYHSATTIDTLIDNLDSDYVKDLRKVELKQMTYTSFFDRYGTHLICEADLGARLDIVYTCSTSSSKYDKKIVGEIKKEASVGIGNFFSLGGNSSTSLTYKYGINESNSYRKFNAYQEGGPVFGSTSFSNIDSAYQNWANNSDVSPTIIGFGEDNSGLLPLSKLIPSTINIDEEEMQKEITNYIINNEYEYTEESPSDFPNNYRREVILREEKEFLITDSGRFNQKHDIISLSDLTDNRISEFKAKYSKINYSIILSARDVDDGYRYIFIYSKLKNKDEFLLSQPAAFTTNSDYSDYVVTGTINLKNQNIGNEFYILYGASGKYDDDWKNYNIRFIGTFVK